MTLALPLRYGLAALAMLPIIPAAPALALSTSLPDTVVATLADGSGAPAGKVTLMTHGSMLHGTIEASGLTPGQHGMHIHAVGKCEGPAFTSAGGHLNPSGKEHGLDNPKGSHGGDLPNLEVGADGKAKASFTAMTTIAQLLDTDGAAFVVHAGPDDGKTDPSGNSGGRVLCGVFAPAAD